MRRSGWNAAAGRRNERLNTGIIILFLCACVLVYLLAGYAQNRKNAPPGMIPSASELFRQKCELEQKMASVTG